MAPLPGPPRETGAHDPPGLSPGHKAGPVSVLRPRARRGLLEPGQVRRRPVRDARRRPGQRGRLPIREDARRGLRRGGETTDRAGRVQPERRRHGQLLHPGAARSASRAGQLRRRLPRAEPAGPVILLLFYYCPRDSLRGTRKKRWRRSRHPHRPNSPFFPSHSLLPDISRQKHTLIPTRRLRQRRLHHPRQPGWPPRHLRPRHRVALPWRPGDRRRARNGRDPNHRPVRRRRAGPKGGGDAGGC
mgnify:CR=1 FL=1